MKTENSVYLMSNSNRIDFLEFNASININGFKLKETPFGTRVYMLSDFPDPPYDIIYFLPDIELTTTIDFSMWDFTTQFMDDFKIMGLVWLPDPRIGLREVRILSNALINLTFFAMNPPIKPNEHIIE